MNIQKRKHVFPKCKNMKNHCKYNAKTTLFEGLQVEGVKGKRCQENVKNDARNHAKINGKTMLDLCSTSDAKHIAKMSKIEAEREPTNQQLYAKIIIKKHAILSDFIIFHAVICDFSMGLIAKS